MTEALTNYTRSMANAPLPKPVLDMAIFLRERHPGTKAIICYGSALRDSSPSDTLIDYYLITGNIDDMPGGPLSKLGCRIMPPNVYYAEMKSAEHSLRAKYAMLPLDALNRKVSADVSNPYFWARFAQPMRIAWTIDDETKAQVVATLCNAMTTAKSNAQALSQQQKINTLDMWTKLFEKTYTTELRPEDVQRARLIVETQLQHFEIITSLAPVVTASNTSWILRKWHGKLLSTARLLKAAFTFQGGADYAAWKISRHSGVTVEITEWHRRHPVLASIVLLPKLLRKGALK